LDFSKQKSQKKTLMRLRKMRVTREATAQKLRNGRKSGRGHLELDGENGAQIELNIWERKKHRME
jgi:hypothetical protein